jgi:hypothetical protein
MERKDIEIVVSIQRTVPSDEDAIELHIKRVLFTRRSSHVAPVLLDT